MGNPRPTRTAHGGRVDLDQIAFRLDDDAYEQFVALLDAPPPPSDALRALLSMTPPWEEQSDEAGAPGDT